MRAVGSLLLVTGTMFALTILGPTLPVAADGPQPLVIHKECSEYTGNVPSFCTITDSTFSAAIPAGTKVLYWGPEIDDPDYTSSVVVINAGRGNRATGYCSLVVLSERAPSGREPGPCGASMPPSRSPMTADPTIPGPGRTAWTTTTEPRSRRSNNSPSTQRS